MLLLRPILGALLSCVLVTTAVTDVSPLRPTARTTTAPVDPAAALAALRVAARPDHMIRYPVAVNLTAPAVRPLARTAFLPRTRWEHKDGNPLWTRAAMSALQGHGDVLESVVPRDIARWCPAYADAKAPQRRAFWVGMMSALAKHESTYNPRAVGGGDLWYGLLQIYPPTARAYGCRARTGEALKNPAANLSCAARIMAVTVVRDNAVAINNGRWRGVAADWGPMTKPAKIAEMSAWTREQTYCTARDAVRPQIRPPRGVAIVLRPTARPALSAVIATSGSSPRG